MTLWVGIGLIVWTLGSIPLAILFLRNVLGLRHSRSFGFEGGGVASPVEIGGEPRVSDLAAAENEPRRVLVVDDDPGLRLLLRTTLAAEEFEVEDAASAEDAEWLARFWHPVIVVLDVALSGKGGLEFCRELKSDSALGRPRVILLTGADTSFEEANAAGADALLRKPFSPLGLVSLIERLCESEGPLGEDSHRPIGDQLLIYAHDLSRVVQIERAQRRVLEHAYRMTVTALADALEARDPTTGSHAFRVKRYALELTDAVDSSLLDDPSLEYGFLLHDIGKIGIPDRLINKSGSLDGEELRVMQQHPLIGAELLAGIALLDGHGIRIVRSHHERWDGAGYPDGLAADEIPIGARIFAVADALDAMTSDRPYRKQLPWEDAVDEILACDGTQFDPRVVTAFATRERSLRHLYHDFASTVG